MMMLKTILIKNLWLIFRKLKFKKCKKIKKIRVKLKKIKAFNN